MSVRVADLPIDELTVEEQLELLGRLRDSLLDIGPPPVPAWHLEEVRRRVAAADADPAASIPWRTCGASFGGSGREHFGGRHIHPARRALTSDASASARFDHPLGLSRSCCKRSPSGGGRRLGQLASIRPTSIRSRR